jgi:serine/threonine-protein kinase
MRERRPELGLPQALDQAVLSCLKKKPLGRPETARELERMLAAVPPDGLVYDYPADLPAERPERVAPRARSKP